MNSIAQLSIDDALSSSKRCFRCARTLPYSSFAANRTTKDGRQSACRACQRAYLREHYSKPESKQKSRERHIQSTYGLTHDQFDALFASQNSVCAVCCSAEPGSKNWNIDHDHITGAVRGILCNGCNTGIGGMRDNPVILRAGADYLEKHGK